MNCMKACRLAALSTILSLTSVLAMAQDTPATREAAANRYLQAVPVGPLVTDMASELSKQMPADQRQNFLDDMKKAIRVEVLERLLRDAMVRHFTTDELTALANFYGSEHGASAMRKFGAYSAQVTPLIQAEVQSRLQEVIRQRQESGKR